ncbi:hypothetical protein K443DRAFT_100281, partial [Laccaria amethystina LaAM-08-1]
YRRHECSLRMAIFFSADTLGTSFGGLLGHLISNMGGIGGRPSWAGIFILERLASRPPFLPSLFQPPISLSLRLLPASPLLIHLTSVRPCHRPAVYMPPSSSLI